MSVASVQSGLPTVSLAWSSGAPGPIGVSSVSTLTVARHIFLTFWVYFFLVLWRLGHVRAQCALACLNRPASPPGLAWSQPGRSRPRRRLESRQGICISWNKGACIYPGSCTFRYVCATCQHPHRAMDCQDTPVDSQDKPRSRGGLKMASTSLIGDSPPMTLFRSFCLC